MSSDVRAKFEEWKKRLLDFSARNRLLFFRPTRTGTLDLAGISVQPLFDTLVLSAGQIEFEGQSEEAEREQTQTEVLPRVSQTAKGIRLHLRNTDKALRKTLTNLYRRAHESLLEQGIHTLHLAIGFLEWYEDDTSNELIRSPLLLVPVQLERQRGGVFALEPTGEPPEMNIVLAEKLKRDLSIQLPEWHQDEEEQPDLASFLSEVRRATADLERSNIDESAMLDIFSFAKLVMYKDLERNTDRALENALIRGICGEPTAGPSLDVPCGEELDRRLRYADCFHVLDADSSQREAIAAATEGESFILVGPPGTGKSQTIANIIAESIAKGKRVLFVSEKAAALDVVHRRLEECGLHHFCLDLHSTGGRKRKVLEQLGDALALDAPATDGHEDYAVLEDERARLNEYAHALHAPFGQLKWTPFEVQSRLAGLRAVPDLMVQIDAPSGRGVPRGLSTVDGRTFAAMESAMKDVQGLTGFFQQGKDHPWWGYQFAVSKAGERVRLRGYLEEAAKVAHEAAELCAELDQAWGVANLPSTIDGLDARAAICKCLTGIGGRRVAANWLGVESLGAHRQRATDAATAADVLFSTRQRIEHRYSDGVFGLDAGGLAERFALYGSSWWRRTLGSGPDRRLLREQLRDSGDRSDWSQLQEDVRDLKAHTDAARWFEATNDSNAQLFGAFYRGPETDWAELASLLDATEALNRIMGETGYSGGFVEALAGSAQSAPAPSFAEEFGERTRRCAERLRQLAEYFLCQSFHKATTDTVGGTGIEAILQWAEEHLARFDALDEWLRFDRLRREARKLGLASWIDHFLSTPGDARAAGALFLKSFYMQWMDEVYDDREVLSRFLVDEFERLRDDFAARDRKAIADAAGRVQMQVLRRRGDVHGGARIGQVATLRRELLRKRGCRPPRQLFSDIPELVQDIAPCMMMSPLTVSQYLGTDRIRFDIVLFDEASQVKPEDALAAIMRSSQLVLAGDPKQLPPTTFFDAAADGAGDDATLDPLESILDEAAVFLDERLLRWHYRSRGDSLIAFSNREFYGNRLITFPDAGGGQELGVRYEYCQEGVWGRGGTKTNLVEAARVADLTLEMVRNHPGDSVGIIAFGQSQQDAIYELFDERARVDDRFESLLSKDDERDSLFIKNLETVQGDERDTIIISVGYGRDADGRLYMNFGPLNQEGGARRLNVAVTRARKRVIVVSSMTAQDIDATTTSGGAQLLRRYLDFAARGPDALSTSVLAGTAPESPFEDAVCAALAERGLSLQSQVGCGPYRVDIGILDAERPGRYALGVECDGRTYHSSRTARDRDRLREQVLRDHGWELVRIWSTDWWRNPDRQIERVLAALEEARREKSSGVNSAAASEEAENTSTPPEPCEGDGADSSAIDALCQELQEEDGPTDSAYGFTPYMPAELGVLGKQDAFYRMAETGARYLLERLRLVVVAEAPVHIDVAMKRLTEGFGISRCGPRIKDLMIGCVAAAERNGYCVRRGGFLWVPDAEEVPVRTNRGSPCSRRISEYALEELALAIRTVVEAAHGAPSEDVVREVARALGFGRTGKDIRERIEQAVSLAIGQGYIEQTGDELLPPQ